MKDLEERDALAERLKMKDKEKTRNIMERPDKKVQVISQVVTVHTSIYLQMCVGRTSSTILDKEFLVAYSSNGSHMCIR